MRSWSATPEPSAQVACDTKCVRSDLSAAWVHVSNFDPLCSSCHTCEALSTPKGPKGPKGADHTDHTSIVHFCSGALRETTCSAKRVETKCSKCSECATAAWDPHPPMPVQRFNPQCLKEKTEWPDKKQISGKRKISWACLEVLAGVRVMHHLVIINRWWQLPRRLQLDRKCVNRIFFDDLHTPRFG